MPRDFIIYGESIVKVKGNVNSTISTITELGLTEDQINISFHYNKRPLHADPWGSPQNNQAGVDKQVFPGFAVITANLVHYDPTVLEECFRLSNSGPTVAVGVAGVAPGGVLNHAGWRMGSNGARFAATNSFIGLNIQSAGVPSFTSAIWRFYFAELIEVTPIPIGTERSVVRTVWQAVPYIPDPWNGGVGANGYVWYDHVLDT